MTRPLPSEVVELLQRAVEHPEGFGPLTHGHLESVAALYQARPAVVDSLRSLHQESQARAEMAHVLKGARAHRGEHAEVAQPPRGGPRRLTAAALLDELSRAPHGLDQLEHAPLETVALLHGVHPFVVDEARELWRARRAHHVPALPVELSALPGPRPVPTVAEG